MKQFAYFLQDECGQGLTEYVLILVMASLAAIGIFTLFAGNATSIFENPDLHNALSAR